MNPKTLADVNRAIDRMEPGHEFTTADMLPHVNTGNTTKSSVAFAIKCNPHVINTTPKKVLAVWRRI